MTIFSEDINAKAENTKKMLSNLKLPLPAKPEVLYTNNFYENKLYKSLCRLHVKYNSHLDRNQHNLDQKKAALERFVKKDYQRNPLEFFNLEERDEHSKKLSLQKEIEKAQKIYDLSLSPLQGELLNLSNKLAELYAELRIELDRKKSDDSNCCIVS